MVLNRFLRFFWILLVIIGPFLLLTCTDSVSSHGDIRQGDTTTIDGIKILYLSGSHYDRGYNHGFYINSRIISLFNEFILGNLCKNNDSIYKSCLDFALDHFEYELEFEQEAKGIIDGINDAGISLFNTALQRELDVKDILLMSSIEELYKIFNLKYGCSSISSWGESTKRDSTLRGDLIITRHWDYRRYESMMESLMLIVHNPLENDENEWVSISWAGMIGSCSAMKKQGTGAFLDYGPNWKKDDLPNISKHRPVSLSIRKAIEKKDYNSDGLETTFDVVHALKEFVPFFSSLIHVVSKNEKDSQAIIIESDNNKKVKIRFSNDNTEVPDYHLVLTNHFRVLYPLNPDNPCPRYAGIVDSLQASSFMTRERSWRLLAGAAGQGEWNIYSVSYIPAQNRLRCSFALYSSTKAAYDYKSGYFHLEDLFQNNNGLFY